LYVRAGACRPGRAEGTKRTFGATGPTRPGSEIKVPTFTLYSFFAQRMMACIMPRPQRIILIRHGESQANVDRMLHAHTPDHRFALTEKGVQQAHEAGVKLYRELHKSPSGSVRIQFYLSPYVRTRQTYQGIMESMKELGVTDVLAYEDPRLREQEFGNYRHP